MRSIMAANPPSRSPSLTSLVPDSFAPSYTPCYAPPYAYAGSLYGLAAAATGQREMRYAVPAQAGQGFAGVLVCMLRIVSKAVFPEDQQGSSLAAQVLPSRSALPQCRLFTAPHGHQAAPLLSPVDVPRQHTRHKLAIRPPASQVFFSLASLLSLGCAFVGFRIASRVRGMHGSVSSTVSSSSKQDISHVQGHVLNWQQKKDVMYELRRFARVRLPPGGTILSSAWREEILAGVYFGGRTLQDTVGGRTFWLQISSICG